MVAPTILITKYENLKIEPSQCRKVRLPYFAVYNVLYFAQIFGGKNRDVYYTWVVLIPYLYKWFDSFIYAYALKV